MKPAAKRPARRRVADAGHSRTQRRKASERAGRVLSERERRFVECFMGAACGNATKAARLAEYSEKTARRQGSRLLTKDHIRQAIAERAKSDPIVWTREQRQRFWTAVASGAAGYDDADLRERLKASELLGRSQADFTDTVKHTGTVTLEQALTASRQKSPEVPRA